MWTQTLNKTLSCAKCASEMFDIPILTIVKIFWWNFICTSNFCHQPVWSHEKNAHLSLASCHATSYVSWGGSVTPKAKKRGKDINWFTYVKRSFERLWDHSPWLCRTLYSIQINQKFFLWQELPTLTGFVHGRATMCAKSAWMPTDYFFCSLYAVNRYFYFKV